MSWWRWWRACCSATLASKKAFDDQTLSCAERAAHRLEQVVRPREQPRLDQRRGDAHVGGALALAVVDRAHAVADLEPDVPQEREEALDALVAVGDLALRQQDQHVDVGAGVQFAAPVAADGDQRRRPSRAARRAAPRPCAARRRPCGRGREPAPRPARRRSNRGFRLASPSASACRKAAVRSSPSSAAGSVSRNGHGGSEMRPEAASISSGWMAAMLRPAAVRWRRASALRWPSSVTRIVCSHWADSE